ncbi:MAG TPA: c-type cytochrome [Terriglobales bacterium]|jgi:mono/diheme cytochrome c family protein|nr:c-type cytochrome [Terriglobales bacterium]
MSSPWKRRLMKTVRWGIPSLCTAVAVLITVTIGWRPVFGAKSRPLTNRQFERTPERMARGKYLVEGVLGCFDCHSQLASENIAPGTVPPFLKNGSGRIVINQPDFLLAAPNLTPDVETGSGTWTDDQFARAIREGIGHDGRTLFPMMPYEDFHNLSDEDLAATIVYIRSLPAVRHELPKRNIPFALSRLINNAPQPLQGPVAANVSDPVSRGHYLSIVGGCANCHTPRDGKGQPLAGMDFAGGNVFPEFGNTATANITPDATGISYYDEALFVKTLRTGHVGTRALKFPMPWWVFRNMSDDDLKSLFAYLRTVKPVNHRVDNSEAVAQCSRCNHKHGGARADVNN